MKDAIQAIDIRILSSDTETAEATFVMQTEDHTTPAAQVFIQQRQDRDSSGLGMISLLLVP